MRDLLGRPPRNVSGGDLVARVLTAAILLALTGMIAAGDEVADPVRRISLLTAAELGVVSVMLGLFLRSNTHFAGAHLLIASSSMLWLTSRDLGWLAIGVGLAFIAVDSTNAVTRRSRLNAFLALEAPRLLEEQTQPDPRPSPRADDRSDDDGGPF